MIGDPEYIGKTPPLGLELIVAGLLLMEGKPLDQLAGLLQSESALPVQIVCALSVPIHRKAHTNA